MNKNKREPTSGQTDFSFQGLRVLAFESRRAEETARIIERFHGQPFVSPSMREIPLSHSSNVSNFANELLTGGVDMVIFMTGVGVRHLMSIVERQVDRQRFLDTLSDVITVARGPKPVAALRDLNIRPTWTVGEPNTWRDLLTMLDGKRESLLNRTVALQEYGKTNLSLIAGLEARGARVLSLQVYRWDLPKDTGPLEKNVKRLANGEADVAMFTSAQQVHHVLQIAERLDLRHAVTQTLHDQVAVASVGPTTSETLRDVGLPADIEPPHPKLGSLISTTAKQAASVLRRKQAIQAIVRQMDPQLTASNAPWSQSLFMRACRREPTETTPIWLMRQAGRYMQEYREVRRNFSFLELCKRPDVCSEIMVTAVNRLGVDAAIIFSDLLPILEPMGLDLTFAPGDGPVIGNPVRTAEDIRRVRELETMDDLAFVPETVRCTRRDLPKTIPVIGFAGAPFTLASYMIEGGSSRSYLHTKRLMYSEPGAWHDLMQRIARAIVLYLNAQIAAGAQCVQLFDSWVGCLGPYDYRDYVLPHMQDILSHLVPGIPVINFGTGNPVLLPQLAASGVAVVGVDWRIDLDVAWNQVGHEKAVQGNLDPTVLLGDRTEIFRHAQRVLNQAASRPGHIFNLGHGVHKETPVDNVIALVDWVHENSQR